MSDQNKGGQDIGKVIAGSTISLLGIALLVLAAPFLWWAGKVLFTFLSFFWYVGTN